jgi:hypothetical protein
MIELARILSKRILEKTQGLAGASQVEARLIFRGPPMEILAQVFDALLSSADTPTIPVLLLLPAFPAGQLNPGVGQSGKCSQDHLLTLRNSPAKPTYVALVPPGLHNNLSGGSKSFLFGWGGGGSASNITFEDWWADEFIQSLVLEGVERSGASDYREDVAELVRAAASAADEIDQDRTGRTLAWRVIARLFEASGGDHSLSPSTRVSLALGMPPTEDNKVSSRRQITALNRVAEAVTEGFQTGIQRIQNDASDGCRAPFRFASAPKVGLRTPHRL